jgi:hypothetical protein
MKELSGHHFLARENKFDQGDLLFAVTAVAADFDCKDSSPLLYVLRVAIRRIGNIFFMMMGLAFFVPLFPGSMKDDRRFRI